MDMNRKRTRDEKEDTNRSDKGKKQALMFDFGDIEYWESYEFLEGFPVFEFPWLKEKGVIFDANEYLEPGDHEIAYQENEIADTYCCNTIDVDRSNVQATPPSPASISSYQDHDLHGKDHDGDFDQVNNLEPIDSSIWSSVIDDDQTLDDVVPKKV